MTKCTNPVVVVNVSGGYSVVVSFEGVVVSVVVRVAVMSCGCFLNNDHRPCGIGMVFAVVFIVWCVVRSFGKGTVSVDV